MRMKRKRRESKREGNEKKRGKGQKNEDIKMRALHVHQKKTQGREGGRKARRIKRIEKRKRPIVNGERKRTGQSGIRG